MIVIPIQYSWEHCLCECRGLSGCLLCSWGILWRSPMQLL